MATRLVLAVAAHREVARRESAASKASARLASGAAISALYLLANAAHSAGVVAACPTFIVSRLGARFGNQTSYQFPTRTPPWARRAADGAPCQSAGPLSGDGRFPIGLLEQP